MEIKQTINFILYTIILGIGIFGMMAISHEAYHYFMIDGQPTGICFGKCNLGNNYAGTGDIWATAAIHWNFTQEQFDQRNQLKEEKEAWIFAVAFTALIIGLFLYSGKDNKKG